MRLQTTICTLLWTLAVAVSPAGAVGPPGGERPSGAPVTYMIEAHIFPDSSRLDARLDVEFRNPGDDSVRYVCFAVPPACEFDSILYYGTPLDPSRLRQSGRTLMAQLPVPLGPGNRGAFFMTFHTRIDSNANFPDQYYLPRWYPEICLYQDGRWFSPDSVRPELSARGLSDVNAALHIDSSWSLVTGGHLINNKTHYGLVPEPEGGDVLVDLLANHSRDLAGRTYRPRFENGRRSYYLRAREVTGFPVLAVRRPVFDRTAAGETVIDVVYPSERKRTWAERIASRAARLVRSYHSRLGPLPLERVVISAVPDASVSHPKAGFIALPAGETDGDRLAAHLAVALARLWLRPLLDDGNPVAETFDRGLAYYLALALDDYRNAVLVDGLDPTPEDLFTYGYIPSWLHVRRYQLGEEVFWQEVNGWIEIWRNRYSSVQDIVSLVDIRLMLETLPRLDLSIGPPEVVRMDIGLVAQTTVRASPIVSPSVRLPVDVLFVHNQTDSMLVSSSVGRNAITVGPLMTDFTPADQIYLVVDPYHRLPDSDRGNNHSFYRPVRFRMMPPNRPFPPYDFLHR